jgi:hypothetical protein
MNEFTLLHVGGSTNDEKQNDKRLTEPTDLHQLQEVKAPDSIVQNVLNYSKALSVRKSKNLKHIENVLN